ncbi:putative mini-circle protein [Streptomyces sp. Tu6071]|nr:putative mini-circle protein [Streptomyces sp. Tu6071]
MSRRLTRAAPAEGRPRTTCPPAPPPPDAAPPNAVFPPGLLLPLRPVQQFPQDVQVAVVAGCFLREVQEYPAQVGVAAVAGGALGLLVQGGARDQFAVAGALVRVGGEQPRERGVDGYAHLAVGVLVGPGALVLLAEQDHLEPVVLDPPEVVDHPAHRHQRGSGQGGRAGVLRGDALALGAGRVARVVEERGELRALVPRGRHVIDSCHRAQPPGSPLQVSTGFPRAASSAGSSHSPRNTPTASRLLPSASIVSMQSAYVPLSAAVAARGISAWAASSRSASRASRARGGSATDVRRLARGRTHGGAPVSPVPWSLRASARWAGGPVAARTPPTARARAWACHASRTTSVSVRAAPSAAAVTTASRVASIRPSPEVRPSVAGSLLSVLDGARRGKPSRHICG